MSLGLPYTIVNTKNKPLIITIFSSYIVAFRVTTQWFICFCSVYSIPKQKLLFGKGIVHFPRFDLSTQSICGMEGMCMQLLVRSGTVIKIKSCTNLHLTKNYSHAGEVALTGVAVKFIH